MLLRTMTFVTTRHSSYKYGSALAAPKVQVLSPLRSESAPTVRASSFKFLVSSFPAPITRHAASLHLNYSQLRFSALNLSQPRFSALNHSQQRAAHLTLNLERREATLNRATGALNRATGALPAEGPIIYATTEFQQESWGTTRTGGVPEDRQATAVDTDQTAAAGDEAL